MAGTGARNRIVSAGVALALLAGALIGWFLLRGDAATLEADDFSFDGPVGSQGAVVRKLDTDHFILELGKAPGHGATHHWGNMVGFEIRSHARGVALTLDVVEPFVSDGYPFAGSSLSYSHDGVTWMTLSWAYPSSNERDGRSFNRVVFPTFTEDRVVVGTQIPLPSEEVESLVGRYRARPEVSVTTVGTSTLDRRPMFRITVTDPNSGVARSERWVHYISTQHPGEFNAQWRVIGALEWLLGASPEAVDHRKRSITHFVIQQVPDAPSRGWDRVSGAGIDLNRAYRVTGARDDQPHETYRYQRDLEALMASPEPPTGAWAFHTWPSTKLDLMGVEAKAGKVPGSGSFSELGAELEAADSGDLAEPLRVMTERTAGSWHWGVHDQFGIRSILVEGGSDLGSVSEAKEGGANIMRGIAAHYDGTRR